MAHTPGPFEIKHGVNLFGLRRDVGHVGLVCSTGGHESNQVDCRPESEANAVMFAAAPDMLAALKEIAADGHRVEFMRNKRVQHLAKIAASAIAKVEGGAP